MNQRPYLVRWWDDPLTDFEARFPWWATDSRTKRLSDKTAAIQYFLRAAVMANNPEDAKQQIVQGYADEVDLEWHSVEEKPLGWSPYGKNTPPEPGVIWDQRPH